MKVLLVSAVLLYCAMAVVGSSSEASSANHVTCDREDKIDLAFLLDASKSVGFMNYKKVVGFVQDFISSFGVGAERVRIGLVYFSVKATRYFAFDDYSDKQAVLDKVGEMADSSFKTELGTRTNTSGGLAVIHELFNENQRNVTDAKMVIVITDGKPNSDKEATIPNADALKADGVKIMAIGVGDDIRRDNLEDIASEPYERYVFTTEDFEDLIAQTEDMVQTACRNVEYLSCPEQESNDKIVDAQHAAIEKAIASLLETNNVLTELDERCNVDPCPSCFTRNDEFRSCYKAVPAAVDWPKADRLCAVLYGARLASVNTAEEHHYIKNQTSSSDDATSAGITKWWVSGNDLVEHGTLMWAGDGHSVNLTVTGDHAHHCVLMDGTNHLNLVRVACGASHGFVCEKNY